MSKEKAPLIYGFHAVEALLSHSPQTIQQLYCLKGRSDKRLQSIQREAEKNRLKINWVDRDALDALVSDALMGVSHQKASHQGVVAMTQSRIETYDDVYLKSHLPKRVENGVAPFILVLDGVTDPYNLGACLRSAEAAGVQFVIIPKDNSASINPTVVKVACGAAEVIPLVRVTNLARTLQWLQQQGVWIIGAASEAKQHHYQCNLTGPLALVMGSEGKGLRRLTRENCDGLIRIPMMGAVSSLNVSVATGVCLFEALRQRS